MNPLRAWLQSVATFFLKHDVFARFMIFFAFFVGSMSVPPASDKIVLPTYEGYFRLLCGVVLAVVPDLYVVAIGHPNSRRSQRLVCSVFGIVVVCVMYAVSRPTGMRPANERSRSASTQLEYPSR